MKFISIEPCQKFIFDSPSGPQKSCTNLMYIVHTYSECYGYKFIDRFLIIIFCHTGRLWNVLQITYTRFSYKLFQSSGRSTQNFSAFRQYYVPVKEFDRVWFYLFYSLYFFVIFEILYPVYDTNETQVRRNMICRSRVQESDRELSCVEKNRASCDFALENI